MDLNAYKSELLSVLADAYDETAWSDAALEEALRQALSFFQPFGAVYETTFALVDSGYEHELVSLGFYELIAVGWPWGDGYTLHAVLRPWRLVTETKIRIDDLSLSTGEIVRVRYRKLHKIQYLDGATVSTMSDTERRRFLLVAAAKTLLARAHYLVYAGDRTERERIRDLREAADLFMTQFYEYPDSRTGSADYVVWGRLA